MKKIISITTAILLILNVFIYLPSGALTAKADNFTDPTTGIIFDTSTGAITGYTGDSTNLAIPAEIDGVSVTSIGNYAFDGLNSDLTSVTIPSSVTCIENYAFGGCGNLTNISVDPSNSNYTSENGVLFDKSETELIQYPNGNTQESYTIPSSVTSIGVDAFGSCRNLTSVTIPSSVTNIGINAFISCSKLTGVTIPSSVTSIGDYVFEACSSLKDVTIPSSVMSIGDDAFGGCSSLTSVTIPSSVTNIEGEAFEDCSSLTSVTIPSSVTSIGFDTFDGCSSLASVTIPSSVTSIGGGAFGGCDSLTGVTIPSSVTNIGSGAFGGCDSLTSVTIPSSVASIGTNAFYSCSSLTSISVDSGNSNYTSENGILFNKSKTELIQYPNGNTQVSYTIPSSVTIIGVGAFGGCSNLTSVTIPSSVTCIGLGAFDGCVNLTIYGVSVSVAQNYAKNNNIPFILEPTVNISIGNGHYTTGKVTVTVSDANLKAKSVKMNGKLISWPSTNNFSLVGYYTITVTDKVGNTVAASFSIDKSQPTLKATRVNKAGTVVKNGNYVNNYVKLAVTNAESKSITKNGKSVGWPGSGIVKSDGVYVVTLKDKSGSTGTFSFTIDCTLPTISVKNSSGKAVANKGSASGSATISCSDTNLSSHSITLNGKTITWPSNGKITQKGTYAINATDKAGNNSTFTFKVA